MKRRSSGSSEESVDASSETTRASRPHGETRIDDGTHSRKSSSQQSRRPEQQEERQRNANPRPSSARIRRPSSNINWKPAHSRNGSASKQLAASLATPPVLVSATSEDDEMAVEEKRAEKKLGGRRAWTRNPWALPFVTLFTTLTGLGLLFAILNSSTTRQIDPKGCRMSWMSPVFHEIKEFDTEHTRFASKYSLHLYREGGVNDMGNITVKGIPVLFIPGNAGSYKQARSIASESARYFHDVLQHDPAASRNGVKDLDFFSADFNEDFTAFHGQTMLDQAEYLNEAIRYILSLYLDPRTAAFRDPDRPDPTSVIILGHSMGGIVARTMLIMPNYQSNSINTIVTMSAPHARPPISFDSQIVKIYDEVNTHWRHAYSQKWANNNPLWHVTLVSIAGGSLDTVVPSDYVGVESIVPETHGFTVFTTSIPTVWTSMDHVAITWCDQFRKVIVRALYDAVDAGRAAQTKPRAERMRVFKKWLLTGMEDVAERSLPQTEPDTLLTLDEGSNRVLQQGERLVLRKFGDKGQAHAYLMPLPPLGAADRQRFTLLSDTKLDHSGENGQLEVLLCSILPNHTGQSSTVFTSTIDLSSDATAATRLACKNASPDLITLPGSTQSTKNPFYRDDEQPISPMSYLEYQLEDLADHQFVAVVDKATSVTDGWVMAEFSEARQYHLTRHINLRRLVAFGLQVQLPPNHPMVTEMRIPSIRSSLLAYHLEIGEQSCSRRNELFAPLVRQFINEPYESKFFVNARDAQVSLHGVTPYVPPPMKAKRSADGLSFQFWTDPTCDSGISIRLAVDPLGSLGKLYMRYRTVFAAFPLLVVALVLRKQFRVYDNTGVFISFVESLDICLRQSLPLLLLSLTLFAMSIGQSEGSGSHKLWSFGNHTGPVDFAQNDLLVGTSDPFYWFLIPLIGIVCIGVCTMVHYMALVLISVLSFVYGRFYTQPASARPDDRRRVSSHAFVPSSARRRLITTAVLLLLVSTFIPYQFAYLVACLVQLSTSVRAHRYALLAPSSGSLNFYNYAYSIFMLMLWVLPLNLPTLVVWVRNLAVHWVEPFSSHHNVLSVLPFILLVESLTTGNMVPRVKSRFRHLTSILLFSISICAAVYGVSHAYMLHYLINLVAAWLVAIHSTSDSWSFAGLRSAFDNQPSDNWKQRKTP